MGRYVILVHHCHHPDQGGSGTVWAGMSYWYFTVIIQTRVEVVRYGLVCHTGTSLLSCRPGWKWGSMGWHVIPVLHCHHTYQGGSGTVSTGMSYRYFTVIIQTRVEVVRYELVCHTGTSLLSYIPGWKWDGMGWYVILVLHSSCRPGWKWDVWAGMSYWYFTVIIHTRVEVGRYGLVCHTGTSLLSYIPGWKWDGMGWYVILVLHCHHTYQGGSGTVWAGMSYWYFTIIHTRVEVGWYRPVCHTGTSLSSSRPGWKWDGMGRDVILVLHCHHTDQGRSGRYGPVCHTGTSLSSYIPGWKWDGMGWYVIPVLHCHHTYQGGSGTVWAGMSYRYFTVVMQTRVEVGRYGPVCHTGTSVLSYRPGWYGSVCHIGNFWISSKSYRHFFSEKHHTVM